MAKASGILKLPCPASAYYGQELTLTGKGPYSFAKQSPGLGDLRSDGNMFEWVGGLRLVDGEIRMLPDGYAAATADEAFRADTAITGGALPQKGELGGPRGAGIRWKLDGSAIRATARNAIIWLEKGVRSCGRSCRITFLSGAYRRGTRDIRNASSLTWRRKKISAKTCLCSGSLRFFSRQAAAGRMGSLCGAQLWRAVRCAAGRLEAFSGRGSARCIL